MKHLTQATVSSVLVVKVRIASARWQPFLPFPVLWGQKEARAKSYYAMWLVMAVGCLNTWRMVHPQHLKTLTPGWVSAWRALPMKNISALPRMFSSSGGSFARATGILPRGCPRITALPWMRIRCGANMAPARVSRTKDKGKKVVPSSSPKMEINLSTRNWPMFFSSATEGFCWSSSTIFLKLALSDLLDCFMDIFAWKPVIMVRSINCNSERSIEVECEYITSVLVMLWLFLGSILFKLL